ncbi:MAG: hypothetical protein JXK05_02525 [Campylobacterales bacterium]|nr:hypothetical protein [Campylobacterales bacterium]
MGASEAVGDFASLFKSDCVSEVYYFSNSWYHYLPGSSTSGLIDIPPRLITNEPLHVSQSGLHGLKPNEVIAYM